MSWSCCRLCFLLSGMITGAAATTVFYNLRLRHPTLELPIIDYDLALLFQPMLILGISIGVTLNVLFADWMIIILLIIFFIGIYIDSITATHVLRFVLGATFFIFFRSMQQHQPGHSSKALKHGKKKPNQNRSHISFILKT